MFGSILSFCVENYFIILLVVLFSKIDVKFLFMLYFCDMELKMNLHCLDIRRINKYDLVCKNWQLVDQCIL